MIRLSLKRTLVRHTLLQWGPFLLMLIFSNTSGALAEEKHSGTTDPTDLVRRLREGGKLSAQEARVIDRIARERGLTQRQVADHLARSWATSERLGLQESRSPSNSSPIWRRPSVAVPLGLAGLLLLADLAYLFLRPRLRERAHLAAMRRGHSASELLVTAPPEATDGEESDAEGSHLDTLPPESP